MAEYKPPTEGHLELSGPSGTMILTADQPVVEGSYTKARVQSSSPESLWVIYDAKNYESPDRKGARIVRVQDGEFDYGKDIASARGFNMKDPAVILFEHFGLRGRTRTIEPSNPNLDECPESFGISALIVTGGVWSFHSEYNYKGTQLSTQKRDEFGPGDYTFWGDPNDKTKSVKFLRHN